MSHPLFDQWLLGLKDKFALAMILRRLDRLKLGLMGDYKYVGQGIYELRVDVHKGYRVYYAQQGKAMYLLLYGGHKKTQQSDIQKAIRLWIECKKGEIYAT
ncbi:MAG: type II toxin-antitoxin system RelE/ParE family toxin [Alcaligenaceae bacterium]|nr:type II toxin-antitoxin system RelE/ParE family toxin [Alcaligenaceae bacterium]